MGEKYLRENTELDCLSSYKDENIHFHYFLHIKQSLTMNVPDTASNNNQQLKSSLMKGFIIGKLSLRT